MKNIIKLNSPHITEKDIKNLKTGDVVSISGTIVTGRDAAHKYLKDTFVTDKNPPEIEKTVLNELKKSLTGGLLYHCGPVVMKNEAGEYYITAAGPTTSTREEPYEYDVIKLLGLRGVIGKGGMGPKTLKGCVDFGAVYLHAIGGAATYTAACIKKVKEVFKLNFGVPEAFWVLEVENFECIVTMDSHGNSLHETILKNSQEKQKIINASLTK